MKSKSENLNPYRTNKGGMIKSPAKPAKDDPKATKIKGTGDLRGRK